MKPLKVLALVLLFAGCAQQRNMPPVNLDVEPQAGPVFEQTGTASWYGIKHKGKSTASGEPFNPDAMTAAHPELPFGTEVTVTNLANGKRVKVIVNDRGPFTKNRIIDLSQAAAAKLGFEQDGTAEVKIEAAGAAI